MPVQQAFDIDALIREANATFKGPWRGAAPLHFTTEYFTAEELSEAWARYIEDNGHFGCLVYSHMWAHPGWTGEKVTAPEGHGWFETSTDIRCHIPGHGGRYAQTPCQCVGMTLTRIQCDGCRFMHIGDREQGVVKWHDLHWPGWRDLPVCPKVEGGPQMQQEHDKKWARANYPAEWQVDGAPVITERERMSTRSVPGRSPWGGFDIASWQLRFDAADDAQWHYDYQIAVLEAEEERERVLETVRRYGNG